MHWAIAPVGSLSSPRFDDCWVAVGALDLAWDRARAGEVAGTAAGTDGAAVAAAAFFTPPWPEHAPRPAVLVVPSAHVTCTAAFGSVFAAVFASVLGSDLAAVLASDFAAFA